MFQKLTEALFFTEKNVSCIFLHATEKIFRILFNIWKVFRFWDLHDDVTSLKKRNLFQKLIGAFINSEKNVSGLFVQHIKKINKKYYCFLIILFLFFSLAVFVPTSMRITTPLCFFDALGFILHNENHRTFIRMQSFVFLIFFHYPSLSQHKNFLFFSQWSQILK